MNIEILGQDGCGPCNALKLILNAKKYTYKYINVSDKDTDNELIIKLTDCATAAGARATPVLFLDGQVVAHGRDAMKYAQGML